MASASVDLDQDAKLVCRIFAEFLSVHGLTYTLRVLEPEARIPKIPQSQLSAVLSNGQQREILQNLGIDFVIRANNALSSPTGTPRGSPRGSPRNSPVGTPRSTPRMRRLVSSQHQFSPRAGSPRVGFGVSSPRAGGGAVTRYVGSSGASRQPMILQLIEFARAHREGGVAGLQQLKNISEAEELLRKREALLERRKEDAERWLQERQDAMAKALHDERARRLQDMNEARKLELLHKKTHQQKQAELDNERERLEMLERKVNRDMQALQRERQHFEFRNQQETMIQQLVEDKKDLTARVKQLSETLVAGRGV
eukprot:INCI13114.1.p1 GENE.INCI13114.1~~INCI13114.1.p1  ORF type:complete len:312 (+),score=68.48 INCI13114.1:273-1208(+)